MFTFVVVFLAGMCAPHDNISFLSLSKQNQRKPSVFPTSFNPGLILYLASIVIHAECLMVLWSVSVLSGLMKKTQNPSVLIFELSAFHVSVRIEMSQLSVNFKNVSLLI